MAAINQNNSSQTLFRFATMRNPELSDPQNKERRFIFRDYNTQRGVIDPRVENGESLQRVCETIAGLTIETEQSLKERDPQFYELAVWVARNKAAATKEEFDAKINDYASHAVRAGLGEDTWIWDNLIYQVVTQEDFYAKEILMQYLHLKHILRVYDGSDEVVYQDIIKAKVVLPKELFRIDSGSSTPSGGAAAKMAKMEEEVQAPRVLYNDKNMKFVDAKMQLQENQNLSEALNMLEKAYKKEYQKEHQRALDAYDREVDPVRKEYQQKLTEQEYKKQLYIDSGKREELAGLPYISAPELPEFRFDFRPEVQAEDLLKDLNDENISALNRVLGISEGSNALSQISTFEELSQGIAQSNQSLQQTILDNTVLNQQVSTSVGGVVVPVTNSATPNGWIPYSVKTSVKNNSEWFIQIIVENFAHRIMSGSYDVTINGTQLSSNVVFEPSYGVSFLFYNSPGIPASLTARQNGFILRGEVVLEDGKTYLMDVTLIQDPSDINNPFKQGVFKGSGAFTLKKETGGGNQGGSTDPNGAFIPSGFGMKNIGVADYRKVEQSTYCYVEGDVAHIENIMAREYKERATRRLKRSESQTTKSSESEKEKLTDTTSTERHEMQSEVAKILQESRDFAANAGFTASWGSDATGKYGLSVGANYATHNSKEESNRQAVTEAKDITARALDRIVTKVKEERIDKILEEYEENNKHGFDNTKGDNHVVGVYRWVDKVVKNQIYNYGKRMMFEFMVPEPAKLHSLGMKASKNAENQLVEPVDPRKSAIHKMENFSSLSNETVLRYWSGIYNVELDERPAYTKKISFSFADKNIGQDVSGVYGRWTGVYNNNDFKVEEGYCATKVKGTVNVGVGAGTGMHPSSRVYICGTETGGNVNMILDNVEQAITVSSLFWDIRGISGSLVADLILTENAKNAWLQKIFNKIIDAYNVELSKYEQALADAKALGVQIKGSNPGFYRKIENTILRRNCISYMLNQNPNVDLTFGKKRYYTNDGAAEETFNNTDIKVDGKLDKYAAFVKFMEQAFEWEIMSYYFYPYYWGERKSWGDLYQFDDNDPTFRAFMQSGMARVIVTVRPGFEEAVRHFMATGQIWNGGEVPVIDDELFLSIVDEMRAPKGTKEGEPWREKIPTSLTILQADSIGLKVEKALPCACEPGVKFDDNLGEMCDSGFELNNNQIGQPADQWMEITFNNMDWYRTVAEMDTAQVFPKTYECLGNSITIDRDASWFGAQPSTVAYKALADEISSIEGVEASPTGSNGITFKINVSKIKTFTFIKPGGDDLHDTLKFTVDLGNSTLKMSTPDYSRYGNERILDKDGQVIPQTEYLDTVPLSKFLVQSVM
ncbi:hypothetical protein HNP38_002130 [Chryseobacterium defluvii]|uniref:Uncharacterized protein n=1 Tax=Chryseobacterium defluvii TaxID=160396 RepID=A0A840KGK2_9FLAO|nr:hypothetical protein [Chryseobacterium defluvii]MBB4806834.1 hypothetical protein [Chryseobacterium defluvii]